MTLDDPQRGSYYLTTGQRGGTRKKTMTTTIETIIPDCIIGQLRSEAAEHGDQKTVADCDVLLAGRKGPGDDEYDTAMARCARTIERAAAMADE